MASAKSSSTPTSRPRPASTRPPETFGLRGPSAVLDRRINAVRGDVADIALAGTLFAPHYAQPLPMSCIMPVADLREQAADDAPLTSQLLYGEGFHVLDISGGWAWGYCAADHYVGYVRADALGAPRPASWRIASVDLDVPMGALIDGSAENGTIETPLGSVPVEAVIAPDDFNVDPVAIAERFVDAPYLLGGRTIQGIDCSGLVQIASAMAGRSLPRDSDLQAEALGEPLPTGAPLRRGDFVTFPGHIGLMVDETQMIHATAHSGKVVIEPLADVEARSETARAHRP